jgi:hypothetical protein
MSVSIAMMLFLAPTVGEAGQQKQTPAVIDEKPVPAGKISTANIRSIVAYLQKDGYRAKLVTDDGRPYVESASNGARFYVYLQNCKEDRDCQDVMVRSSYEKDKEKPVNLDVINAFNRDHRWVRAYLDKQGDPVLEYDILFTNQLIDEKMFGEAVSVWSDLMADFHKVIEF